MSAAGHLAALPGAVQPGVLNGPEEEFSDGFFFAPANAAMAKLRAQVERIARADAPVLLLGESGVEKEALARLIHKLSPRSQRPFLKVNCAALPADLLESELFGYEAGAFTGAIRSKPGRFELCNNGTILLDEIGEMPPTSQAKLLLVLQDGQFSRLGGRSLVDVDVRVLAATNVDIPVTDLKAMVRGLKTDAEKEAILVALERAHWSRKEAAGLLKISRKALFYKMVQYGIIPEETSGVPQVPDYPVRTSNSSRQSGVFSCAG